MYVELQVAILKAYLHDLGTPICQIVFLGPCRSNLGRPRVAPVLCNVQAQIPELALPSVF